MAEGAKSLVRNILKRLEEYEGKHDPKVNKYRYICHNEFDSNTSDFENLSNNRLLVVKTRLTGNILILLMDIFHAIYDDNYWRFESDEVFDDLQFPFKYEDVINIDISNPDNFGVYMSFYLNLKNDEEIKENIQKFIGENQIYESVPVE